MALSEKLQHLGVGLVHCADVQGGILGAYAGRLASVPVLSHVRSRRHDLHFRECLFLAPVTEFVFVSQSTRESFSCRRLSRRSTVLYDGVPDARMLSDRLARRSAFLEQSGFPADSILVGMTARLHPGKDFESLLVAFADVSVKHPELRLVIAGGGAETEEGRHHAAWLERLATSYGISGAVRFLGHVDDVGSLLQMFDVYVLSTHSEGFPLGTLEAMAHGVPVIATAVDGVPEQINHGETGYLVPPQSPAAIADCLYLLARDPKLRHRIGERARMETNRRFSLARFQRQVVDLYHRHLEVK